MPSMRFGQFGYHSFPDSGAFKLHLYHCVGCAHTFDRINTGCCGPLFGSSTKMNLNRVHSVIHLKANLFHHTKNGSVCPGFSFLKNPR